MRRTLWPSEVMVDTEFNNEFGIYIKLPWPIPVPTERYYAENLPNHIKNVSIWKRRMDQIADSILKAVQRPDAPILRFATSRFIDAAMRGLFPDESRSAIEAFEVWRKTTQALLWFEWRSFIKKEEISLTHFCTPHTCFHTWLTPNDAGTGIAQFVIAPFTLVDQYRSAALFDSANYVMVVY